MNKLKRVSCILLSFLLLVFCFCPLTATAKEAPAPCVISVKNNAVAITVSGKVIGSFQAGAGTFWLATKTDGTQVLRYKNIEGQAKVMNLKQHSDFVLAGNPASFTLDPTLAALVRVSVDKDARVNSLKVYSDGPVSVNGEVDFLRLSSPAAVNIAGGGEVKAMELTNVQCTLNIDSAAKIDAIYTDTSLINVTGKNPSVPVLTLEQAPTRSGNLTSDSGGTSKGSGSSSTTTTNPTTPTEPTEPTTPTEPAPTEPTEPTMPTEPAPTEPTEPTMPTEPTTPTEPTEPTPPPKPTIFLQFYSDVLDIPIGKTVNVSLFAEVQSGMEPTDGVVQVLDESGASICSLYDNAQGTDAIMGDNIFSGTASMGSNSRKLSHLYAEIGNHKSDPLPINFFPPDLTTSAAYQRTLDIESLIQNIGSPPVGISRFAADDTTSAEQQLDAVESILVNAMEEGDVVSVTRSDEEQMILADFASGVTYLWAPENPEVNADSGDNAADGAPASWAPAEITGAQAMPEPYSVLSSGIRATAAATTTKRILSVVTDTATNYQTEVDKAARYLTSSSLDFTAANYIKIKPYTAAATVASMRTALSGYDVVLWNGHGNYAAAYHSVLTIGETYTAATDATYSADLSAKRILHMGSGNYSITPAFISKYYPAASFAQTVFFFGACLAGKDSYLANSLLGGGAASVLVFDEAVYTAYNGVFMPYFFQQLSTMEASGTQSTTVLAAMEATKKLYGQRDSDYVGYYADHPPASLLLFGDKTFSLYKKATVLEVTNASFESGLNYWTMSGDCRTIQSMGALKPTNGNYMAMLGTGMGYLYPEDTNVTSVMSRSFTVNKDQKLLLDYNFVSEELPVLPEWIGQFNDTLQVSVIVGGTSYLIKEENIFDSSWTYLGGDYFYGGDDTTYQTGWKTLEIDFSKIGNGSVINTNTEIQLVFRVWDVGDSYWDSVAIIDNLRAG